MSTVSPTTYTKPRVVRFGTLRQLTRVGCTAGGDGIWICRTPGQGQPTIPLTGGRS